MEKTILSADIRKETGKQSNRRLRNQGGVPAVAYKKGKETVSLTINSKELFHVLHTSAGENVIITLKVKDESKDAKAVKDRTVIIKEIQYHPIRGDVLHLDLNEISLTDKITVNVPIETKGEPEGAKADGGILDQPTKEVQLECLPTNIPEKIEVHVEEMMIGDSIRVKDLDVPADVKVLSDPELTVASVVPPQVEKTADELAEGEEVTEPEVIMEKKLEAEGEGAPAPAPEAEKQPKKEEKEEKKEG
ncbi:MAG: 50S ribosomal protein L25 [Candidatus Omnitrophica bacterium]|nr:50S ribosomal protein L25 [Candidatus Omnitrophota bacterium]